MKTLKNYKLSALASSTLLALVMLMVNPVSANDLSGSLVSPYDFGGSKFRVTTFDGGIGDLRLNLVEVAGDKGTNYFATLKDTDNGLTLDLSNVEEFGTVADVDRDEDYTVAVFYPLTGMLVIPYVIANVGNAVEVTLSLDGVIGSIATFRLDKVQPTENPCLSIVKYTFDYYSSGCGYNI